MEQAPFAALADTIGLGMAYQIVVPPDGGGPRFAYVGPNCLALNGVTAQAVMADPNVLHDLLLPDHRERLIQARAKALARQSRFDIEVALRRPDGEIRWSRIASAPRPGSAGAIWDGVQVDITDRKRVELELQAQRSRLELAVEATGLGLWEWDLRADRLTFTDRNRAIYGLAPGAEVDIDGYMQMVHNKDRDGLHQAYLAARDMSGGGEFSHEYRVFRTDREPIWVQTSGRVICDEGGPMQVVGTTLDITARRKAEENRELVLGELGHRAKNGLSIVMALVSQTARNAPSVAAFEAILTARLQSMADSQTLVTTSGGRPPLLSDLVDLVLKPFDLSRFDLDEGLSKVGLTPDMALALALLLHEMATNALKYGALSATGGRVAIGCAFARPGHAVMAWEERGGPPVSLSNKLGFGSRLLQAALRNQGGGVEARFDPHGFNARLEFPIAE